MTMGREHTLPAFHMPKPLDRMAEQAVACRRRTSGKGWRSSEETTVMDMAARACPFCEWTPRPFALVETDEREQRAAHIGTYHRDRLRALAVYRQILGNGGSEAEAREAHNRLILPQGGPGRYARQASA
jgi:hypothetical protein